MSGPDYRFSLPHVVAMGVELDAVSPTLGPPARHSRKVPSRRSRGLAVSALLHLSSGGLAKVEDHTRSEDVVRYTLRSINEVSALNPV